MSWTSFDQTCDRSTIVIDMLIKLAVTTVLCGSLLPAQSGKQVVPPVSVHQYSGISPLSANNDKLHTFDGQGRARIVRLRDAAVIADPAPYPEAHWDNTDNDLMWLIGDESRHAKNRIETWRPSTRKYQTVIDYRGRFATITTGGTTDISYDGWEAFSAPSEHQVCAVDLKAKKTYCLDYNAPDPVNKMGDTKDVDYVAVTPRDSKSGLHYVLMLATPAMAVFSVDESAGTLRWIVRPEAAAPWMGSKPTQNNDGNCDPGESCLTTPHGDLLVAPDGQVYFEMGVGMEADNLSICESGQALMRLNAGVKMSIPEKFAGLTGGGLKYAGADFHCGGKEAWSSQHTGCARWGQRCVVSFSTAVPQPGQTAPRKEELWLIGLTDAGAITFNKIGVSSPSFLPARDSYWSTARAAMSMDGTLVIYDSDHGSQGASHAVYSLETGLPPVSPLSPLPPRADPPR